MVGECFSNKELDIEGWVAGRGSSVVTAIGGGPQSGRVRKRSSYNPVALIQSTCGGGILIA